jgi:hypothetical protein
MTYTKLIGEENFSSRKLSVTATLDETDHGNEGAAFARLKEFVHKCLKVQGARSWTF